MNKTIYVNRNFPDYCHGIIVAHELGHALIHSSSPVKYLVHSTLFPIRSMDEIEANCFAAELIFYNIDGTINRQLLDRLPLDYLMDLSAYKVLNINPETDTVREYLFERTEKESLAKEEILVPEKETFMKEETHAPV